MFMPIVTCSGLDKQITHVGVAESAVEVDEKALLHHL
jgi:hypothetical protein